MSCEIPETTKIETVLYTVTVSDPTNDTVICSITTVTTIFYLQVGSNQYGNTGNMTRKDDTSHKVV